MRLVYADPPYLGCCRLYEHNHPIGSRPFDGRCWDDPETHRLLLGWLAAEFPDGFALSCHEPGLRTLLPMAPPDVRVAAWGKTFCAFRKGVRPAYAWEPVLFRGGRNPPGHPHPPPPKGGAQTTPKDFLAAPIAMERGFPGAKPPEFARWVFELLGAQPSDEIVDLFPGSGAVGRAWEEFCGRRIGRQLQLGVEVW